MQNMYKNLLIILLLKGLNVEFEGLLVEFDSPFILFMLKATFHCSSDVHDKANLIFPFHFSYSLRSLLTP